MEIIYYIVIKVFNHKKRSIHFFFYNKKTRRKEGKSNSKNSHCLNVPIFVKSCMLTKNHILGFSKKKNNIHTFDKYENYLIPIEGSIKKNISLSHVMAY